MSKGDAVQKIDVTKEDQDNINSFNKLNSKMHELEQVIKAKKKVLEDLEDASNELMLSDEESVRYVLGECFVTLDKEAAEQRLEKMTGTLNGDVKDTAAELEGTKKQMAALKAQLYGKFGNSINLDE